MAEAFLNTFYGDHFKAYNAGITPKFNPYTIRAMAKVGIDISG
jgi:protein-tyrosine-phosphatase